MGISTDAIHAGQLPDPTTGAIMLPIYQTSTYVQEGVGKHKGYEYARTQNPTREALEKNVAVLEKGAFGIAFSSGMAAIHAVIQTLEEGNHVLLGDNLYGGTFRLMQQVMNPLGMAFDTVSTADPASVEKAIRPETRLLLLETPSNPVMIVSDIRAIAGICQFKDKPPAPAERNPAKNTAHKRKTRTAGKKAAKRMRSKPALRNAAKPAKKKAKGSM